MRFPRSLMVRGIPVIGGGIPAVLLVRWPPTVDRRVFEEVN